MNSASADNDNKKSMEFLTQLGQRISTMADLVGGKKKLADAAGISESQLYRCIKGASATTVEPLVAMAKAANVSIEWAISGEGLMQACPDQKTARIDTPTPCHTGSLPLCDKHTTCAEFAPPNHWAKQRGLNDQSLRLITARGDSMEPTITNGSLVLIDTGNTSLEDGYLYALREDTFEVIRRIQRKPGQGIWLLTDNTHYTDILLAADDINPLGIIGRVVWIGRDV
ncbi:MULTISPECIES: S24 family peptidase [unclassified Oceanobacter]|jgi:SOS-response transcriptional repressor LexA|uniref:LexA family transcriptional regulator n=1 Tax=unclassified Oceanobacter TaxID=2620260 RepID=UPI0026E2E9D8|nr:MULTISPECIES: S24 family peptidase [unclassified Oceanobacter]MDO6682957.1 S24 family peptidase [Oceanobacter sp. 5_MG-2023]MDP2506112.1 S24 family peptidase [Oceanobacter sp. 3_MG-2023]MDP2547345.1 S24 family peptidase [Oceanobacter sp. 4_MG-2023]MDP2607471.1 S24 family peptidase [Oceanobacter sp. 1_MG-2023]MDP2610739.1 S24 family peptidase [Oceanobacter sp. 2_MG-2023]